MPPQPVDALPLSLWRERRALGGEEGDQLSPNSWPLSEPGPRMKGLLLVSGWGGLSRKQKLFIRPPPQKEKKTPNQKLGARAPPTLPTLPVRKSANIITKMGSLRGPLPRL